MHQAGKKERGSVASTRAAAMTALRRFIHLPLAADHQVPSPASPTSHYPFVLDLRSEASMKAARFLQSEVHEILPGPSAASIGLSRGPKMRGICDDSQSECGGIGI